ncbi:MAG: DUF3649 domain-containing protein [Kiloniellaceae bacterium]
MSVGARSRGGVAAPRLDVLSRCLAAVLGGYGLAVLTAVSVLPTAARWPALRAEAVLAGTMASFVVWTGACLWVFAARSAARAWGGLCLVAVLVAGLGWASALGGAP